MNFLDFYYSIKPLIPRRLQIAIRRQVVRRQRVKYRDIWPIDPAAGKTPPGWPGWPEGKQFALVLTHDVESAFGLEKVLGLAGLEESLGFRSCFNFVGQDYPVYDQIRKALTDSGFEVGLHGLTHKGNLFRSRKVFEKQRPEINRILKEWGAVGFRAPSMYHHLEWTAELDIEYDLSTFDTDPFEPQPDGAKTIFPFWVPSTLQPHSYELSAMSYELSSGFVELPYTLPQDSTLFLIMQENNIQIWKDKLDWIVKQGGMVLVNTYPDYMTFNGERTTIKEYPVAYYSEFLKQVTNEHKGRYWNALPREVAEFWQETCGHVE